jgi:hypothetical protein
VWRRTHRQPYRSWETLVWAIQHAVQTPLDETPDLKRSLLHPHLAEDVSLFSVWYNPRKTTFVNSHTWPLQKQSCCSIIMLLDGESQSYTDNIDLLGCHAVWTCRWVPTFWRNILPLSSRLWLPWLLWLHLLMVKCNILANALELLCYTYISLLAVCPRINQHPSFF